MELLPVRPTLLSASVWPIKVKELISPENPEKLWIAVTIEGRRKLMSGAQVDRTNGSLICTEEVLGADSRLEPCRLCHGKESKMPCVDHCRTLIPVQ